MVKPIILILGATGSIGTATLKHLSAECGSNMEIRASSRTPSKVPDSVKLPGVQLVKFEFGDTKENLKATFTGVDRLFIIPPSLPFSGDVVSEAATAAKEAGVKHVLLLSASSAEMNPDHKYAPMKGSYYYIQKKVLELFPSASVVCLPFFMENNLNLAASVKAIGKFSYQTLPDRKIPWMAVDDAGKCAAKILADPEKHSGNYYRLINGFKSYKEFVTLLGDAVGKPIEYDHITYQQFEEGMTKHGAPQFMIELLSNLSHLLDEQHPVMLYEETQDHHKITGQHPVLLKQWCVQHAPQFQ